MSTATLTTADVQAFALKRLADILAEAAKHHGIALKAAGEPEALHRSRCIELVTGQTDAALELANLCCAHGDMAADRAIFQAWDTAAKQCIQLASEARMASIPGWDPATRSFRKEPA